ncbi:MAG: efflux transporter outer membrane subunit [Lysobacterales bacterium]|nr:MAG: efflux transporter outer membrane subunit [Xanthomonadales bacterium]
MTARHQTLSLAVMVVMAVLGGCAITPPPAPEEIRASALQGTEIRAEWSAGQPAAGPIGDQWLRTFADPRLDALVDEAISRNPDLRAAAARVEQSAAYAEIARGALRPSVGLAGTATGNSSGSSDFSSGMQGLMLSASWELDLWGRLRYGRSAAEFSHASAQADFEFARQSLAAQVARSWFIATEARLNLETTTSMAQAARQLLQLSEDRRRVGIDKGRDVALASANLGTLEDMVRQAQQAKEQASRSLELILGRYPATELQAADAFPALPGPVPVGMPLDMLERRPDMVAAERRVAAAFDRVGEAKAARLPRLTLTAGLGVLSSDVLEFKDDYENPAFGIGAGLLAPIYQGGQLKAQVAVRTAEQAEALARYASQALTAIGDVENALGTSRLLAERIELLSRTLADQQRAFESDLAAYRAGRQDLRPVLQQQMQVQSARMALLRVQSEQLIQRVNLHLALGGSFAEPVIVAAAGPEQ